MNRDKANAQTTIYSTNFGTIAATTTNCLGNFSGTGWTFSGANVNISIQSASSGYTGASGGAYLGEGNSVAFVNTACTSEATTLANVTSTATLKTSTTNFTNIVVSFGYRKSSATYAGAITLSLGWSTDNINYTPITVTGVTDGNWGAATPQTLQRIRR